MDGLTNAEMDRRVRETHACWPNIVISTCYYNDGTDLVRWWCVQEGDPPWGLRYRFVFPGDNFDEYLKPREKQNE